MASKRPVGTQSKRGRTGASGSASRSRQAYDDHRFKGEKIGLVFSNYRAGQFGL
ncbi:hypothetical protein A2U01_0088008, partial [Trifolium medium]|nr:hypothetical protein [Trifolium medium]